MKADKQNKLHIIIYTLLLISTLFSQFACSKKSVTTHNSNQENLLKKYKKEGFIDLDTFRVIIVEPASERRTESKIKEIAQRRAYVSFQKYIRSQNKSLRSNSKPFLLNLISANGKLIHIAEKSKSRYIYIFEVKKQNLRNTIDDLGY